MLQEVLSRIPGVRRSGTGYLGRCPAHDDAHPSLKIAEGDSQPVVMDCKAGCSFRSIEAAMGFEAGALSRKREAGRARQVVATYTYRNSDGSVFARKERCLDDVGAKRYQWSRPDPNRPDGWLSGTKGEIPIYRLPELIGASTDETVMLVEGEKDADRLADLGFVVTTTPNGAGSKWRNSDSPHFMGRKVCIIADDDEPGRKKASDNAEALRDVASAVGVVILPNPERRRGFDVSDFLDAGGALEELTRLVSAALAPRLPAEVVTPEELNDRVTRLWEHGDQPGVFPGWDRLDPLFRPREGELTIVTGAPNAGKSTFLDDMMVRISCGDASSQGRTCAGWRWLVFSAEQFPPERHASKLLQKLLAKPFGQGPSRRITREEIGIGMNLLHEHFVMLNPSLTSCTLDRILEIGRELNAKRKLNALVIDPFNIISANSRSKGESEHEFVNAMLARLRTFAQSERMHVFVVAHPTKMRRDEGETEYPVPRPWDISGSAHWFNHADAILCVWRAMRDTDRIGRGEVEIHSQKIRFQPECGQLGMVRLYFDRITTRFLEEPAIRLAPWEKAV
jgi:twinkle protein